MTLRGLLSEIHVSLSGTMLFALSPNVNLLLLNESENLGMLLVVSVRHNEGYWSAEDIIRGRLVTFDESTAEKSGTEGPVTFQTRMVEGLSIGRWADRTELRTRS